MNETSRRGFLGGLAGLGVLGISGRASAEDALTDEDRAAFGAAPLVAPPNHPLNSRIPAGAQSPGLGVKFERNPPPMGGYKLAFSGQIFVPSFTYFYATRAKGANGRDYARLETRTYPGGFVAISRTEIISSGASAVVLDRISLPGVPSSLKISFFFNRASAPRSLLVSFLQYQARYDYPSIVDMRPSDLKTTGTREVGLGGSFLYRASA
ncbi:MAG: hypothetical protein IPK71_13640 [Myxococcales bacterium]|nr:hypothetical protein [Myxococcales bacterium]